MKNGNQPTGRGDHFIQQGAAEERVQFMRGPLTTPSNMDTGLTTEKWWEKFIRQPWLKKAKKRGTIHLVRGLLGRSDHYSRPVVSPTGRPDA